MDTVMVDGLRIAYERAGAGPALVLLHGYVADGRTTWRRQLDGLCDEFTVVAWDAPGVGGSSDPPEGFGMAGYADCLAGFVDALGLDRPNVVGLSFGGSLALAFEDRHVAGRATSSVAVRPRRRGRPASRPRSPPGPRRPPGRSRPRRRGRSTSRPAPGRSSARRCRPAGRPRRAAARCPTPSAWTARSGRRARHGSAAAAPSARAARARRSTTAAGRATAWRGPCRPFSKDSCLNASLPLPCF